MKKMNTVRRITFATAGVSLGVILLEIVLRAGGFLFLSFQDQSTVSSPSTGKIYKILALGESTTGLGGAASWPKQLETILNTKNIGVQFVVINTGIPGATSGNILTRVEELLVENTPDMVVSMIGINDEQIRVAPGSIPRELLQQKVSASEEKSLLQSFRVFKLLVWIGTSFQRIYSDRLGRFYNETPISSGARHFTKTWEQVELALWNIDNGLYGEAETLFRQAIILDPKDYWATLEFANLYRNQGKLEEAMGLYESAIRLHPQPTDAFLELGNIYRQQGKYEEAIAMLQKAQQSNVLHEFVSRELAQVFEAQGKAAEAQKMREKAQGEDFPKAVHQDIGTRYRHPGRYEDVERQLLASIKNAPTDPLAYREMANFYERLDDKTKSIRMYEKVIELDPSAVAAYTRLIFIYQGTLGSEEKARQVYNKAITKGIMPDQLPPLEKSENDAADDTLAANYRQLKNILRQRKIVLVAVQYPLRSIQALREILGDNTVYVDNEKVFQEALQLGKYEEYFTDRFAGNFGHATAKGNALLANSIANVIVREVFKKQ